MFLKKECESENINRDSQIIHNPSERKEIKTERLRKVAISAMKQSLKYFLPEINEAIPFNEFISKTKIDQGFICFGEAPFSHQLHAFNTNQKHNVFLIGPEGDFSSSEIATAISNNYTPIQLGPTRLRTETAGIFALSVLKIF
jgi:16S rRNA (uracil1498-N3)-methyltransferase